MKSHKSINIDGQACHLQDVAADTFLECLVEFQYTSRRFPVTVIATLGDLDLAFVVHDDAGDSD